MSLNVKDNTDLFNHIPTQCTQFHYYVSLTAYHLLPYMTNITQTLYNQGDLVNVVQYQ